MNSVTILKEFSLMSFGEIDLSVMVFESEKLAHETLDEQVQRYLSNTNRHFKTLKNTEKEAVLVDCDGNRFVLKIETTPVIAEQSLIAQKN